MLVNHPADDFAPSLSPDGSEVAFHSWRTGTRDIFVQPVQPGDPVQVTASDGQQSFPRWSPDGRRLAFHDQLIENGAPRGLFIVERAADGTWGAPVSARVGSDSHANWLPSGQEIVYGRAGAIEILSLDSGEHRVIYEPTADGDPESEAVELADDGRLVYFKSHDAAGRASIWSLPVAGGRPRLLVEFTDPDRPSLRPDFAAGGGRFFFTTEDRQSDVWVADIVR
jgi:Tol biopolymer transport system component